jgi:hypothetical protein
MPATDSHKAWEVSTAPTREGSAATALTAYWQSRRRGEKLPARSDIDPVEIPRHLLPNLFMFDVLGDGADYRYRLVGTELVAGAGRDSTGAAVSHLYQDYPRSLAGLRRILERVRMEKIPVYATGSMFWRPHQEYKIFEAVFLPLCAGGESVDIVLGGLWPDPTRTVEPPSPAT